MRDNLWGKYILEAITADTMALVFSFLADRGGVEQSALVALGAALLKASEAKEELPQRNAMYAIVRVFAHMARQQPKWAEQQWKGFVVPDTSFKDAEQQDVAVLLLQSVLDSKTSTAGMRKIMEKERERMDLPKLCAAVNLD